MNNNDNYQRINHTVSVNNISSINMTDADWSGLLDKISERKTVLVVGDGLTRVNNMSLVEYISSKLFEQVKMYYYNLWDNWGVPKECYEENLKKKVKLPTNVSIMDMNWGDYSEAFSETKSGDLVQFIKKIIDEIPACCLDYSHLKDLISLGNFNIILSTSYSKDYKEIVEEWALNSNYEFFYADIQNDLLVISPSKLDTLWNGLENQVLFINLMGHICNTDRSLNHLLVTEEDMILFVCSWIIALKKSTLKLTELLKDDFLLVLGCHVPSWAFRFIWYIVKNPTHKKISNSLLQSLCSRPIPWDDNVSKFILRYSAKIIDANNAIPFISELKKRWLLGSYDRLDNSETCVPPEHTDVFVSYASEDRKIVEEQLLPILQSLNEEHGFSFWYDKQNLRPSNQWEAEIKFAIEHTCVFLALQTPNSKEICKTNKIKYLRHEWKCATDRNARINNDHEEELKGRFSMILPVLVTSEDECLHSPLFKKYQYISMTNAYFCDELKQSIQEMIETNRIYIE